MKKIYLGFLTTTVMVLLLVGCIVKDNYDDYERNQFRSTEEVSEIIVTDISTDITVRISDSKDVLVEYSDSPTGGWYEIAVANRVLKIGKTRGTVGVEDNSLIISLPEKNYQNISIETTNGDIIFDDISSMNYKCSIENGNIKGALKGDESNYLIVTNVQNGKSNLENNVIESSNIIEFNVKNGDVDIKLGTNG